MFSSYAVRALSVWGGQSYVRESLYSEEKNDSQIFFGLSK